MSFEKEALTSLMIVALVSFFANGYLLISKASLQNDIKVLKMENKILRGNLDVR